MGKNTENKKTQLRDDLYGITLHTFFWGKKSRMGDKLGH